MTTEYILLSSDEESDNFSKQINASVRRLRRARLPSSTYPLLMPLLADVRNEALTEEAFLGIANAVETFLVRRAVVGLEPTGLLVFFRGARAAMGEHVSAASFKTALQRRGTIEWPDDERFKSAIRERKIYKSNIVRYFLEEYEKSLGADVPSDNFWIEHVLPQVSPLPEEWSKEFPSEDHERLVHTAGNLILLSGEMNGALKVQGYEKKRKRYQEDAMFASARRLADSFEKWGPDQIRDRSSQIADWAVKRWRA